MAGRENVFLVEVRVKVRATIEAGRAGERMVSRELLVPSQFSPRGIGSL